MDLLGQVSACSTTKCYKHRKADWHVSNSPLMYSMEAVMVNQFHGMELECSPSHIIPGIPGISTANQACNLAGARPGSLTISGTDYIKTFGYDPSHLWRNFGVLIAFTVLYIIVAMLGVEYMDFGAGGGSIKILTKPPPVAAEEPPIVEEKQESSALANDTEKSMDITRRVTTVKAKGSFFTWRNVDYSVGDVQLLHGVNGYCKPGRLTALMGPSGAGKTTLLDNLGMRKRVGVISGELRMDGRELAPDFGRSTAFVEQQDVHDGMYMAVRCFRSDPS